MSRRLLSVGLALWLIGIVVVPVADADPIAARLTPPSVTVDFPSPDSTLYNIVHQFQLGSGGNGVLFEAGSFIEERFIDTGLPDAGSARFRFSMSNFTLEDTVSTFDVVINGMKIGNYFLASPIYGETVPFDLSFSGFRVRGDDYTLRILATNTVPSGFGSYNWFPGGSVVLKPAPVPEPATMSLLGMGVIVLVGRRLTAARLTRERRRTTHRSMEFGTPTGQQRRS